LKVQAKIDNPGEHHCVTCAQPLEGTDHIKTVLANLEAEMNGWSSSWMRADDGC
jgi:hypothetical protein